MGLSIIPRSKWKEGDDDSLVVSTSGLGVGADIVIYLGAIESVSI